MLAIYDISNKLTFDLESGVQVTCDVGYVPILVFDLGPMYVTDVRHRDRYGMV